MLSDGNQWVLSLGRGGIGIGEKINSPTLWFQNDRIIDKWLTYAGCHDVKTIDRHLAAIRSFENFLAGKQFGKLTTDDVAGFRDDLKRRAKAEAPDRASASTIKHIVSHLSAFFDWLLKQDGFKRLPQDLQGYLKLPKATLASAPQVKQMDYPTLAEAADLLNSMPSTSLEDQRAGAIFAIAFLGPLRADTLISLKVKHFDIERRLILQDADNVRAKAGKHMDIFWFPIQAIFHQTVVEWVKQLRQLGFSGEDALFPDVNRLKHRPMTLSCDPVPVMTTKHAVTKAFAIASCQSDTRYTPHAARHSIAAERKNRRLTDLERKAWCENMGHENEATTERHYAKLSDEQRFEVLESIGEDRSGNDLNLSDEAAAALAEFFKKL